MGNQVIEKQKIAALKTQLRGMIDLLDSMNDETYERINDFSDPDHGRFSDLLDWAQYLANK